MNLYGSFDPYQNYGNHIVEMRFLHLYLYTTYILCVVRIWRIKYVCPTVKKSSIVDIIAFIGKLIEMLKGNWNDTQWNETYRMCHRKTAKEFDTIDSHACDCPYPQMY